MITMNELFYHLIHDTKTKRWFLLLAALEEQQQATANELAEQTNYSTRTINADIKAIKRYFCDSIKILGDGQGYHFSFQCPMRYTQKKQELIENEGLFIYLEHLFHGEKKSNSEWADILSVSTASFGRMKRSLIPILKTYYYIEISSTNQLEGNEAAIRQLMYDFYYTLPLYPALVEEKITYLITDYCFPLSGRWQLDPLLFKQWAQIAFQRTTNGFKLPQKKNGGALEKKLAIELDQMILVPLSSHEKAALFLLSLKEEQFINPFVQKEFVRLFSPIVCSTYQESLTKHFFETIVYLMNYFFQLSTDVVDDQLADKPIVETAVQKNMMTHYLDVKRGIQNSLGLFFELAGTPALQSWIKKTVREQLKREGYSLFDSAQEQSLPNIRKIKVSNKNRGIKDSPDIYLKEIPEEKEIKQAIQKILA